MRRSRRALAFLLASTAAALPPCDSMAQEVATGINLEHFVPGAGAGALLGLDGAGPPSPRLSMAASLDYARGLLTIRGRFTGALVSTPVRSLAALDLSAEATLWRGLSIGIGLPVALSMTGDRLAGLGLGDESPLQGRVLGDLRIRLRHHLGSLMTRRGRVDGAVLLVGTLPLGGESQFFATAGPTIEPRLLSEITSPAGWLRLVVLLGYRVQSPQRLYDTVIGGLGGGLHLAAGLDLHVPKGPLARFHAFAELESMGLLSSAWLDARAGLRVVAHSSLAVDAGVGGVPFEGAAGQPSLRLFTTLRAGW